MRGGTWSSCLKWKNRCSNTHLLSHYDNCQEYKPQQHFWRAFSFCALKDKPTKFTCFPPPPRTEYRPVLYAGRKLINSKTAKTPDVPFFRDDSSRFHPFASEFEQTCKCHKTEMRTGALPLARLTLKNLKKRRKLEKVLWKLYTNFHSPCFLWCIINQSDANWMEAPLLNHERLRVYKKKERRKERKRASLVRLQWVWTTLAGFHFLIHICLCLRSLSI